MKICAGWTLNHRKPIRAPMIRAQKTARFGWRASVARHGRTSAISRYATKLKIRTPAARPSSPSVRFTALLTPTITKAMNRAKKSAADHDLAHERDVQDR